MKEKKSFNYSFYQGKKEALHTVVSIPAIYLVLNQQRKIGWRILTTLYILVSF